MTWVLDAIKSEIKAFRGVKEAMKIFWDLWGVLPGL
jgi:hypothetical protein